MSKVQEQYDAYPYPERDPADEGKRLVTGSPSHPVEIDHVLYAGNRDWSQPFRALVAGGGSGDALIQLAQVLTTVGAPHEIVYVDLSTTARGIAEARARARGLTSIAFHTGSLLDAPDHGLFDYIDCCGVLHHLPDPQAGLAALRAALKDDGGLGWMVYAPYGRSGVYPLQEAFGTLFDGLSPPERLKRAQEIMARLPEGHPFRRNTQVVDHTHSDAGFYDLLLHSQDRAYRIDEWGAALEAAGFALAAMRPDALYDPAPFAPLPKGLGRWEAMALAERLAGTIRKHVGYARPAGATAPKGAGMQAVPHIAADARQMAQAVAQGRDLPITSQGVTMIRRLPREAAPVIAGINGRRSLSEIATGTKINPMAFQVLWGKIAGALEPAGVITLSRLATRRWS